METKNKKMKMIILLIALLIFVNISFFSILNLNDEDGNILNEISNEINYQRCLATTRNPNKITDNYFMVQYDTTLSENEITNHVLRMGFNYSSIEIINDYYLIAMNNEEIKEENPGNINEATTAEFTKFSEFLLNHSSLITLAIRNPKGIMAMKVEFRRDITEKISRPILDELILEYNKDEIWSKVPPQYYFNERKSWAHVHILEGSGITEVEGYCKFLMEDEVTGAQLIGDKGTFA